MYGLQQQQQTALKVIWDMATHFDETNEFPRLSRHDLFDGANQAFGVLLCVDSAAEDARAFCLWLSEALREMAYAVDMVPTSHSTVEAA